MTENEYKALFDNAVARVNDILKEFCKELHTPAECAKLLAKLSNTYYFDIKIDSFKTEVDGITHPYIYGQYADWVDLYYSIHKENDLIRYEMHLRNDRIPERLQQ